MTPKRSRLRDKGRKGKKDIVEGEENMELTLLSHVTTGNSTLQWTEEKELSLAEMSESGGFDFDPFGHLDNGRSGDKTEDEDLHFRSQCRGHLGDFSLVKRVNDRFQPLLLLIYLSICTAAAAMVLASARRRIEI